MIIREFNRLKILKTRKGKFKSTIIPHRKHTTKDLDKLIRAMLIAGVSTRKMTEILKELYGYEMSSSQISRISQVAVEEIQKWRSRPLREEYAVVFLDAMMFF